MSAFLLDFVSFVWSLADRAARTLACKPTAWVLCTLRFNSSQLHASNSPSSHHPPLLCAGWDVRGPVIRLWAGQRDYQKLRAGLDPGSSDAIKAILMHAQRYDEQYGSKTYRPSQGSA